MNILKYSARQMAQRAGPTSSIPSATYQYEQLWADPERSWGVWFVSEGVFGCIMHPQLVCWFQPDGPGVCRNDLPTSLQH